MKSNPGKRPPRTPDVDSRTTADATPTLAAMIQQMNSGATLEDQISLAFTRLGQPFNAAGVSVSWSGMERLVQRMTELGCCMEMQVHADHCVCRVLRLLKGKALAKKLAGMEAGSVPETVAKAALLALVGMEPPTS